MIRQQFTLANRWLYQAKDVAYAFLLPVTLFRLKITRKWSIAIMRIDGPMKRLPPKAQK